MRTRTREQEMQLMVSIGTSAMIFPKPRFAIMAFTSEQALAFMEQSTSNQVMIEGDLPAHHGPSRYL